MSKLITNRIYSIGYGQMETGRFLGELVQRNIQYLIDVRSYPTSRFRPDFRKVTLERLLTMVGIQYVHLGGELGGRPSDPTSLDNNGHVDYTLLSDREQYRNAIARIVRDVASGRILCLMCSESKPEDCHRSKLIGESLLTEGLDLRHILPDGLEVNQVALRLKFISKQGELFGHELKSRLKYSPKQAR